MTRHGRLRRTILAIACVASTLPASGLARAATPAAPAIVQLGNGNGKSDPVISGFDAHTVLIDKNRFAYPPAQAGGQPTPRVSFGRYIAYGTITNSDGSKQLALAKGSDDGLTWQSPIAARLQEPNGVDAPFLVGALGYYDAVFNNGSQYQFQIYYSTGSDPSFSITTMRFAQSTDGVNFVEGNCSATGCGIAQDASAPLITGAASTGFRRAARGPTEVLFTPGPVSASCGATQPYACPYAMLYDASDGAKDSVGVAWSTDGITFHGLPAPAFSTPATGWDRSLVTDAHIRRTSDGGYLLYFAGAAPSSGCAGVGGLCASIGEATSGTGLSFTEVAGPATPSTLFDGFTQHGPSTLSNVLPVSDSTGATLLYLSRTTADGAADTFLAGDGPAPSDTPAIFVHSPAGARSLAGTPVDLFVDDTFGAHPGVASFAVSVDTTPFTSALTVTRTLVGAYGRPAYEVSASGDSLVLADGTHKLDVTAKDLDGNIGASHTQFLIDTTPPATKLVTVPQYSTPPVAFVTGLGQFEGETIDGAAPGQGTPVIGLRVVVTDPLGRTETIDRSTPYGFPVQQVTPKDWKWRWVAPAEDAFYALPGNYTVSVLGVDTAGNVERPSSSNTATILAL